MNISKIPMYPHKIPMYPHNIPMYTAVKSNSEQLEPNKYTLDKSGNIRADFIFSYWILIWFIVYYFIGPPNSKIVQFVKTNMNPAVGLWIALLEIIINEIAFGIK